MGSCWNLMQLSGSGRGNPIESGDNSRNDDFDIHDLHPFAVGPDAAAFVAIADLPNVAMNCLCEAAGVDDDISTDSDSQLSSVEPRLTIGDYTSTNPNAVTFIMDAGESLCFVCQEAFGESRDDPLGNVELDCCGQIMHTMCFARMLANYGNECP